MAPHQTKKGKHESNTSDVLRTGEGQSATGDRELSWQHTGNPGSTRHIQKHILRMESRSRDWQGGAIADRKHAAQLLSCFAGAETPEDHQQDTGARAMHCASTFARKARRHRRTSQYAQLLYSRFTLSVMPLMSNVEPTTTTQSAEKSVRVKSGIHAAQRRA